MVNQLSLSAGRLRHETLSRSKQQGTSSRTNALGVLLGAESTNICAVMSDFCTFCFFLVWLVLRETMVHRWTVKTMFTWRERCNPVPNSVSVAWGVQLALKVLSNFATLFPTTFAASLIFVFNHHVSTMRHVLIGQ